MTRTRKRRRRGAGGDIGSGKLPSRVRGYVRDDQGVTVHFATRPPTKRRLTHAEFAALLRTG